MKKIIIFLVLVAVVVGFSFWYFSEEKETDELTLLLNEVYQGEIQEVEFQWNFGSDAVTILGKGFEIKETEKDILSFFESKGFIKDVYNLASDAVSERTGFKKDSLVCVVDSGFTGYKEAEGQWIPTDTSKKDIEVKCGVLIELEQTFQEYTNQEYGYSFSIPSSCILGPTPSECKQVPPEEREESCLCFLNTDNPNEVSFQTFTGPKDDLVGATLSIFHFSTKPYNPPSEVDLIDWLKQEFSYQDIPDEVNFKIDDIDAVKVYAPQSQGAFSQENIYFIIEGKLFNLGMIDVDDANNRKLYDSIINSFKIRKEGLQVILDAEFSIELDSNPSTGYSWEVDFDGDYLDLVGNMYLPDDTELIGSGGKERFTFKAKKQGEAMIYASYLRSWEEEPIEEQEIRIIVK